MLLCLLMMTFLVNGIKNAEQRTSRLQGSVLGSDDLDSKAKAWLLMVESGRADEEQVRKITPKSIFIAPLLTSRSNKCKEGYRHDHLGQCVKVIKLDQRAQLELLLKRLSAMYTEKKVEQQEGLSEISSGPLHFSLPISNADGTTMEDSENGTSLETTAVPQNETEEGDYPVELNQTAVEEGSGYEGSGYETTTETVTLISEELDYMETTTETTTDAVTTEEVPYTTEAIEGTNETAPNNETNGERREERPDHGRIVFPEDPPAPQPYPVWNGNYQYDVRKLPSQQFWWLPHNWRVDEEQHKPAVFKFWSHLPLVHDPSFIGEQHRKPEPSTRIPDGYSIELQQPLATHRRGRLNF